MMKYNISLKIIKRYATVFITCVVSGLLGFLIYPYINIAKVTTDNPGELVATYYKVLFTLALSVGAAIIAFFLFMYAVSIAKNSKQEDVYKLFQHKGFLLRVCYGFSSALDTLLAITEIAATGLGTYIVLVPNTEPILIAILLITTFLASSLRNVLNLQNNRKAYAKAFREIEYALDEYYISEKTHEDRKKLCESNERAQSYIELLFE